MHQTQCTSCRSAVSPLHCAVQFAVAQSGTRSPRRRRGDARMSIYLGETSPSVFHNSHVSLSRRHGGQLAQLVIAVSRAVCALWSWPEPSGAAGDRLAFDRSLCDWIDPSTRLHSHGDGETGGINTDGSLAVAPPPLCSSIRLHHRPQALLESH